MTRVASTRVLTEQAASRGHLGSMFRDDLLREAASPLIQRREDELEENPKHNSPESVPINLAESHARLLIHVASDRDTPWLSDWSRTEARQKTDTLVLERGGKSACLNWGT